MEGEERRKTIEKWNWSGAPARQGAHTKRSMCLAPTRRGGRRYKSPFSSLKNQPHKRPHRRGGECLDVRTTRIGSVTYSQEEQEVVASRL